MRAAIVSPSAPVTHTPAREAQFEAGLATLQRLGIQPVVMPHAREAHSYVSASVDDRLADLHAAYTDSSIQLIIASNGGRSCNQLLRSLDVELIRSHPKPLVGFSDITVLLNALWGSTHRTQLHGPMVAWGFDVADAAAEASFIATLQGSAQRWALSTFGRYLRGERLAGTLIGGNLTSLEVLLGTPFEPQWDGAVLLWEEVGEPISRLDRVLTHLQTAGIFGKLGGMVVGHLEHIEETYAGSSTPALDIVLERTAPYNLPVLVTERFGHPRPRITLPIGGRFEADGREIVVRGVPL